MGKGWGLEEREGNFEEKGWEERRGVDSRILQRSKHTVQTAVKQLTGARSIDIGPVAKGLRRQLRERKRGLEGLKRTKG